MFIKREIYFIISTYCLTSRNILFWLFFQNVKAWERSSIRLFSLFIYSHFKNCNSLRHGRNNQIFPINVIALFKILPADYSKNSSCANEKIMLLTPLVADIAFNSSGKVFHPIIRLLILCNDLFKKIKCKQIYNGMVV